MKGRVKVEYPVTMSRELREKVLWPLKPEIPIYYGKADEVIFLWGSESEFGQLLFCFVFAYKKLRERAP
jgi:hypothetical protein